MSVSSNVTVDLRAPGAPEYPCVKFAAVESVQYALTKDTDPETRWKNGCVMLVELVPGEFSLIVTIATYTSTIDSRLLTMDMETLPDWKKRVVRWSTSEGRDGKCWTHVRFTKAADFATFNCALWSAFHEVAARHEQIHARLSAIAYDWPSNFTKYCCQYLGDAYFDNLEDEELSGGEDDDEDKESQSAEALGSGEEDTAVGASE